MLFTCLRRGRLAHSAAIRSLLRFFMKPHKNKWKTKVFTAGCVFVIFLFLSHFVVVSGWSRWSPRLCGPSKYVCFVRGRDGRVSHSAAEWLFLPFWPIGSLYNRMFRGSVRWFIESRFDKSATFGLSQQLWCHISPPLLFLCKIYVITSVFYQKTN